MSYRAIRWGATIAAAMSMLAALVACASSDAAAPSSLARADTISGAPTGETYSLSFSPNVVKDSAGLTLTLTSPQQPLSVTVGLPAGAALNPSALPMCSTPPACEPSTQVGSGTATVGYNQYVIPLIFAIYNRPGGLAIVVSEPNATPVVVLATWAGTTLTIPYPTGTYKGVPIVIEKLGLTFNQTGTGAGAYIRNPPTCPKGGWVSQSTFSFATGATTAQVNAAAKCSVDKKKKKAKKKKKKK